jgi:hypothetical protein
MRRSAKLLLTAVGVFTALTPAMAHAADQPLVAEATLVGAQDLPAWSTLPVYKEGGFSGLHPVAGEPGHFWTVSDRGPNGEPSAGNGNRRPFPSPAFAPSIYKLGVDTTTQQMTIIQRLPLKLPVGSVNPARATVGGDATHLTGLANSGVNAGANIPTADEPPVGDTDFDGDIDAVDANLPYDPYGVDTEGIAIDPRDGAFWLVEEYRPSILRVDPDGTVRNRYTPAGQTNAALGSAFDAVPLDDVLPAAYSRRRANRGFEGVAIDPTGMRLYAIVQNPLAESCAGNDPFSPGGTEPYITVADQRSATRIAEIDITDPANPVLLGDYVYTLDTDPGTGITVNAQLRIGDLYYSEPGKLLVIERDDSYGEVAPFGDTYKRVYEVDLSAATKVQTLAAGNQTCLSAVKPVNLDDRGITPVTKSLVLDLGSTAQSPEYPYDKLEGLTRLPNGNYATVDDNDFQVPNPTKPTKYIEYGVAAPPPVVPESPLVVLLPVGAVLVGGAYLLVGRRRPTMRTASG